MANWVVVEHIDIEYFGRLKKRVGEIVTVLLFRLGYGDLRLISALG